MSVKLLSITLAGTLLVPQLLQADHKIEQVINQSVQRSSDGAVAQRKVNKLDDQAKSLLSKFAVVNKRVDGLKTYNSLLSRQIENQHEEITALQTSIQQVTVMERQIVPLMIDMIKSLNEFIKLDTPFLIDERTKRIKKLRNIMARPDITHAEKFRKVIEAYEIEIDYGRTIEAYKGSLNIANNAIREVDFLRFGRVALMYQTLDNNETGAWNPHTHKWERLPDAIYRRQIDTGIAIARKQTAPDMLVLPIPASKRSAP